MASLGNIAENPHVGIMLVDFVHDPDRPAHQRDGADRRRPSTALRTPRPIGCFGARDAPRNAG